VQKHKGEKEQKNIALKKKSEKKNKKE